MSKAWPSKPLGDLLSFLTSGSRGWATHYRESGDLFLRIQNVGRNRMMLNDVAFVAPPDTAEARRTLVQPGDVLLSITADLGRTGVVPDGIGRAFINQHLAILRVKNIHPSFLSAFLASPEGQKLVMGRNKQAVKAGLNFDDIRSFRIPLPPLAEQRRIAVVLDRAEVLRAKRRAALAELDSLTQSLFLDLFGDPVTNPKGWPVSSVGDVADVQGGLQVTTARKNLPNEVPYLRVANVYRCLLNLREIKMIRATDAEVARTKLVKDDLLIVEGHGNPAEIGRSALWDGSISGCIHQNHIIRARFTSEKVVPLYACEYLNSPGGRRHLLRAGKTTTGLNTISVSEVRGTPISVPPIKLQREFTRRVTAVEKLKTAHRASLAELDALFATLQHRAFRGEL